MKCPKCGSSDLESFAGDFPTGVVAPDGVKEMRWEEGVECLKCGLRFDIEDAEEEAPECPWCGKPADDDHIRKCSGYKTPLSRVEILDVYSDPTDRAKRERFF